MKLICSIVINFVQNLLACVCIEFAETSFDNKSVPQMETQEVNFLESTDPGFGDQLDEVLQLSDEELQGEDDEVTRAFSGNA